MPLEKIDPPHKFFLDDPDLSVLGLPDDDLVSLYRNKKLVERPESQWYEVKHDDDVLAVTRVEPYGENSLTIHLYLSSKHRGTGIFRYVALDIIVKFLDYDMLVAPVPEPCTHVSKALEKIGFKLECTVKNCTHELTKGECEGSVTDDYIWRGQKVKLLKYTKEIEYKGSDSLNS